MLEWALKFALACVNEGSMAPHSGKEKKGKARRGVYLVIEIVCIAVAIVCAVLLFKELGRYWVADNDFKEITQEYERDVDRLETDNPNCVGWVTVKDTRIDYPVMYTPDDPEYYLHRNFDGEYSSAGTPFLGAGSDPNGNSIILYGHHMSDGSMFAELLKFDDAEFGTTHTIEYKTVEGVGTYKPIACWYEDLTSGNYYKYWEQVGTLDAQRFADYVSTAKSLSLYDTGTDAAYDTKLITLSTCSYGTSEQRFVVVAAKQ